MSFVDFTDRLAAFTMPDPPKTYRRIKDREAFPGLLIEVYANELDSTDQWLAPRSCCELLGLGRNWLNTSYDRPGTMKRLVDFGFNSEKRMVTVRVENSNGLTKPCIAIEKSDFIALMRYAVKAKKPEAIAIRQALMVLGVLGVAGLASTSEEKRNAFNKALEQSKRD